MLNIGFIGCGNMGSVLATAVNNSQLECKLYLSDANHSVSNLLSCQTGGTVCDNIQVAKQCDYIFLAVKPNIVLDVAKQIAPYLKEDAVIISMAAGMTIDKITDQIKSNPIIRIMPNTPAAVGLGVILYTTRNTSSSSIETFRELMKNAGALVAIDEETIDSATAVSGCGPAYAYMFIEALANAGIKCGVPSELSLKLAAETVKGAAEMVLKSGITPKKLCENVCSPGGSTIEGVRALQENNFDSTVESAIKAAYKRTKELAN